MVPNILKDLYGNSGNRFKKINTHWDFNKKKNALQCFIGVVLLLVWLFSDQLRLKRFSLPPSIHSLLVDFFAA